MGRKNSNLNDSIQYNFCCSKKTQKQTQKTFATCSDKICKVCGNDHTFKNNFQNVRTSIDAIPELLQTKNNMESLN
jgi:hypothetical protein